MHYLPLSFVDTELLILLNTNSGVGNLQLPVGKLQLPVPSNPLTHNTSGSKGSAIVFFVNTCQLTIRYAFEIDHGIDSADCDSVTGSRLAWLKDR